MKEFVKISDDIFEKETAGTIFADYYVFLTMQLLCSFDNRIYSERALLRGLRRIDPEIKKEDMSSSLQVLLKEDYIGMKGKTRKNYFSKDRGKKKFMNLYAKLLEYTGYLSTRKTTKLRKSRIQEYNDYASYDPRYLSLWLPEYPPTESIIKRTRILS